MRPYSQILADASSSENSPKITLQFKISKTEKLAANGETVKPKSLTNDQFGDFIFDSLGIKQEDCLEIDLSGRWDTKELVLRPNTDVAHILTAAQPFIFLDHEITVTNLIKNITRITFKNVPLSVPDEEIIQICKAYSEPVDCKVHREVMRIGTSTRRNVTGATRYVEVRLIPGRFFRNFYWVEGPLPGDQGRRITALHPNQPPQCSNCFRYAASATTAGSLPCPGAGNGKACEAANTPRARMSDYVTSLRLQDHYVSLKTLYIEEQARSFPGLQRRRGQHNTALHTDNEQQANISAEQMDQLDIAFTEGEARDIVPQTPMEQREAEVQQVREEVLHLRAQVTEVMKKEEETRTASAEAAAAAASLATVANDRFKLIKVATERRMAELFNLNVDLQETEGNLLATYTNCLDMSGFYIDQETQQLKPQNEDFLADIQKNCELDTKDKRESFEKLRTQILHVLQMYATRRKRKLSHRRMSESLKRDRSGDEELGPASRLRAGPVQDLSSLPSDTSGTSLQHLPVSGSSLPSPIQAPQGGGPPPST